jgi:hypothetical protein
MKPRAVFFLVFVWSVASCVATAQDVSDRFAEFQLEKDWADDGFSVLIERFELKVIKLYVEADDENAEPSFKERLATNRAFQRLVIGDRGRKKRIDSTEYGMLDASEVFGDHKEAQLIHENVGWYNFRKSGFPKEGIIRFEVKGGIPAIHTRTKWKHPFVLAATVASSILDDNQSSITRYDYTTLEKEELADGRKRYIACNNVGGAYKLTFAKEPGWLLEEVEFFKRTEEAQRANPVPPKSITRSDFDKYEWFARTHTQWKQASQNRFVPWQTNLYQKGVHREAQCEFRFRDWKFGKDVDLSLLEEESFQEAKIDASIDFFKIKEFFDLQSSK